MPTFAADRLHRVAVAVLEAAGTAPEGARIVADSLVDAKLAGHDSHGVIRLLGYLEAARNGHVDPAAEPTLLGRDRATARVDGRWGWGQPAMRLATGAAIEGAREFGVGVAAVRNCSHIGRVAPYVETIARAGMVGIALANAGPAVAPFGGRARVMGTNPIAWAAPRADGQAPLAFDIATSAVAEGKLRVAVAKGERVAPGLIVDADGQATEDPADFYAGGALLPFGGHKGYGFSLLAQVLGRGLAGMDPARLKTQRGVNGPVVLALDVAPFAPLAGFVDAVEAQCAEVLESPPGEGFAAVLLPGDQELAERARRLAEGIPVPERTWEAQTAAAAALGVAA